MLRKKFLQRFWGLKGDFSSFREAADHAKGYSAENIAEKVFNATRTVIEGNAEYERDSVLFYESRYNYPLLTALLSVCNKTKTSLNVLDFGGALGSSFWQNRKYLEKVTDNLSWHIVEQNSFLQAAEKLIYNAPLFFHSTIEEAQQNAVFNAVLFSSVLQYLEKPRSFLEKVRNVEYLIIDRHPEFAEVLDAQYSVQYVHEPIYEASYPVRIWGKDELKTLLSEEYQLLMEWESDVDGELELYDAQKRRKKVHMKGMFFRRKAVR
ncbi:MAG: methyltransferase, TIGR04325 family [Lentisphaeria bacterium]|nr:methyltransferase, TIGR04325 family [Lentisphaeria bacterium]